MNIVDVFVRRKTDCCYEKVFSVSLLLLVWHKANPEIYAPFRLLQIFFVKSVTQRKGFALFGLPTLALFFVLRQLTCNGIKETENDSEEKQWEAAKARGSLVERGVGET